jgi:hypothetical protein
VVGQECVEVVGVAQKGTGYASLWALVYVFSPMCYISPPSSCARPRAHTQRQPLSFVASPGSIPRISHNPLAQAWLFFWEIGLNTYTRAHRDA